MIVLNKDIKIRYVLLFSPVNILGTLLHMTKMMIRSHFRDSGRVSINYISFQIMAPLLPPLADPHLFISVHFHPHPPPY